MTKTDLVRSMERQEGGYFITKAKLAKFIGAKRAETVGRYVEGLQVLNKKYYFIPEVAEKMMADVTTD
nr:hypothetical protein [Clostridia bacterium]